MLHIGLQVVKLRKATYIYTQEFFPPKGLKQPSVLLHGMFSKFGEVYSQPDWKMLISRIIRNAGINNLLTFCKLSQTEFKF